MKELPPSLKMLEHHKKFEGKIPHLKKTGAVNVNGNGNVSSGSSSSRCVTNLVPRKLDLPLPASTTLTVINRPGESVKREPQGVMGISKSAASLLADPSLAKKN